MEFENKSYLELVKKESPKSKTGIQILFSFLIGGLICCIGQFISDMFSYFTTLDKIEISGYVSISMIFLGSTLTGIGIYDRIGKIAGGGSLVPITGFANSIVSPAMEFKHEGFIYGVASKMFVIAGPIIVYGISSSVLVGLIYYVIGMF